MIPNWSDCSTATATPLLAKHTNYSQKKIENPQTVRDTIGDCDGYTRVVNSTTKHLVNKLEMETQACCGSKSGSRNRDVGDAIDSELRAAGFFCFFFCLLLSAGIRLIWLIYWPLTMSDCVKCGGPRLTSDSKHTGVGSVTAVRAWTPCRYLGPVGPARPAASTPSLCFHGRSV